MAPCGILKWSLLAILTTGLPSICPVGIYAQDSSVVCDSTFNWMNNSKNQNPCVVGAYLQAACNDGQFTINPLPNNTHYIGPSAGDANACQCSSVTYNVISACGLCQDQTIISWTSWDFNCTTIYPGVFTPGIPAGTAVPQWAFQDVTTSNTFNVTEAQVVGDSPESTATVAQSTATSAPSSTSVSAPLTTSSASASASPSSESLGSKTNTGAIAGGVVGGVVGVALIAGLVVFFVLKRKRSQMPLSAQIIDAPVSPAYPSPGYSEPTAFSSQMIQPQTTQPKLYDPSDPSTYPTSPAPPTIMTSSSQNFQSPTLNYSMSPTRPAGSYSGVPEI